MLFITENYHIWDYHIHQPGWRWPGGSAGPAGVGAGSAAGVFSLPLVSAWKLGLEMILAGDKLA